MNNNVQKQEKITNSSQVIFERLYTNDNMNQESYQVDVIVNTKHYTLTIQGEEVLDCKERTNDQLGHEKSIEKSNIDKDKAVEILTNINKTQAVEIVESIQQAQELTHTPVRRNTGGGALLGALLGTILTGGAAGGALFGALAGGALEEDHNKHKG